MADQQLSVAAAQDEVDAYEKAVVSADEKIEVLQGMVSATRKDRARLNKQLDAARKQLREAKREHKAAAGAATGEGSA